LRSGSFSKASARVSVVAAFGRKGYSMNSRLKHSAASMALSALAFVALALGQTRPAHSDDTFYRCPGAAGGPAVTFDFRPEATPGLISLEVDNLDQGMPAISVFLDEARVAAFVHEFQPGECAAGQSGERRCAVAITAVDPRYRMLMMVFKLGRDAHVIVERDGAILHDTRSPVGDFALEFDS
jgi:hypothetical protein